MACKIMRLHISSLIVFLMILPGCEQKSGLTERELDVCQRISFDRALAARIKEATNDSVSHIPAINAYGELMKTTYNGLCSAVDEEKGYNFVLKEKENFRANGYLLFLFEDDAYNKYIGTIKGRDELDIVRWRQTNGVNYGYENSDIIAKLEGWKKQNDFIVMGASMDWLQFKFKTMPDDMDAFATDVYEFCPDIVDQGTGDIPTLIQEIKRMQGLFLWWD